MKADEFGAYGIEALEDRGDGSLGPVIDAIRSSGFAILDGVFPAEMVSTLSQRLDDVYAQQCAESGGEDRLALINDADIVRCLLAYDDIFIEVARHPAILKVVQSLIGENIVLLMQNGIINRPDRRQFQTNWHRDLNYQHWTSSKPIAVSTLICLEDFNDNTGGTVFLAGSQLAEHFPDRTVVEAGQSTPSALRGSVIVFDSMVFHRSGINRSGRLRRGINQVYGRPFLAQQIDIPAARGSAAPDDPALAALLGYRWKAAASVTSWRQQRIDSAMNKLASDS